MLTGRHTQIMVKYVNNWCLTMNVTTLGVEGMMLEQDVYSIIQMYGSVGVKSLSAMTEWGHSD